MKRFSFLLLVTFFMAVSALAQEYRFVYLQTEKLQPFYIQMNGKTISSTASGYLLMGKMTDNSYPIKLGVVGFSDVQEYVLKVDGRNAGYIIKQVPGMGWAIQDLQTGTLQMSMETVQTTKPATDSMPPTGLQTEIPAAADKPAPVSETKKEEQKIEPAKPVSEATIPSTAEGASTTTEKPKLLDIDLNDNRDTVTVKKAEEVVAVVEPVKPIMKVDTVAAPSGKRQPCVKIMNREEVEGLMSKANGISDMDSVMKIFENGIKDQCITTSNIRKICQYMASDVARYNLMSLYYPHTLDFYEFSKLEDLLQDNYYLSKFRALIK